MKMTRLVAVLLALYAGYNIWIAVTFSMPLFLLWTGACLAAAIGSWRERPWSRWLVYLIAVLTALGIVANIVLLALSGWPLGWPGQSLLALAPAVLAVALCGWMVFVMYRRFRPPQP